MKICFACSPGGHLFRLAQLSSWWMEHDRFWIVPDRPDTRSYLPEERIISPFFPTTRSPKNAIRNVALAFRVLRQERPDVVVSTGAGIAAPFFAAARSLGIATVYIEGFGRIDEATLSGRLCYPMSTLFLLQWPEQQAYYARGILVGPVLPTLTTSDEGL
jgi:UDP-N-acetylglucosamine:LPS N-acetylglucosamine transferase